MCISLFEDDIVSWLPEIKPKSSSSEKKRSASHSYDNQGMTSLPLSWGVLSWENNVIQKKILVTANTVTVEANTVPVEANTVSVTANTVPVEANTVPVTANTVPVEANTVPVKANTV